jgi:hypothetical protein
MVEMIKRCSQSGVIVHFFVWCICVLHFTRLQPYKYLHLYRNFVQFHPRSPVASTSAETVIPDISEEESGLCSLVNGSRL